MAVSLDEAKTLIFRRLCSAYKMHGEDGLVKWRDLPQELGILENVYGEAIKALREEHVIELLLPLHVRLGPSGVEKLKEGKGI